MYLSVLLDDPLVFIYKYILTNFSFKKDSADACYGYAGPNSCLCISLMN